jgi:hypothetical protein
MKSLPQKLLLVPPQFSQVLRHSQLGLVSTRLESYLAAHFHMKSPLKRQPPQKRLAIQSPRVKGFFLQLGLG